MTAPFCQSDVCRRTTTCDICMASHARYVETTIRGEVETARAMLRSQGWTLIPPATQRQQQAQVITKDKEK